MNFMASEVIGRGERSGVAGRASVVMDGSHPPAAIRYVALNPVRARLVARARDWPWSSVGAHLKGNADFVAGLERVLRPRGQVIARV